MNDLKKFEFELKDAASNKVKQGLTNHGNGTFSKAYNLSGLPSSATNWTWKGKIETNAGAKFQQQTGITVN